MTLFLPFYLAGLPKLYYVLEASTSEDESNLDSVSSAVHISCSAIFSKLHLFFSQHGYVLLRHYPVCPSRTSSPSVMFFKAPFMEKRASAWNSSQAFSVSPSGNWDGNDGAWSTFMIRVGTPAQLFRVLPSTSLKETLIPIPYRCEEGMGWCGNARGVEPFNGGPPNLYSGSPDLKFTTTIDAGGTCTANRSPMCVNCISINGKCTNGPCTGRYCCGDPAGDCASQSCKGLNGICSGDYIGCPCSGVDYNADANTPSASALNPLAASGFQANLSSTWSGKGNTPFSTENYLDIAASGPFGMDTVGLGVDASTGVTLNATVIAGVVTEPFYIGQFGLKPSNSTDLGDSTSSFMSQLKAQKVIPSLSYGYTGGAVYGKV